MLWPSNLTVRRLHALDGGQGKSGKLGHLVLVKSEKGARGPHLLRCDHEGSMMFNTSNMNLINLE